MVALLLRCSHVKKGLGRLAHNLWAMYLCLKKDINFNVIEASNACLPCLAKLDHIKSYRPLGFCYVPTHGNDPMVMTF